ncbi:MAG: GNAT family N-acetyltransferase [Gemmatimonadaceae bacterium]
MRDGGLTRTAAKLRLATATEADAAAIALLRTAAAERLTDDYGPGHWSGVVTDRIVLRGLKNSRVLVARRGAEIVGTLRLATKKPWAIDAAYFTRVDRPLYLTDMAVDPRAQRQGVGRELLNAAVAIASAWPADAIRLDSYDADAGAGPFYEKCGFREVGRVTYRGTPLVYYEMVLGGVRKEEE